MVVKKSSSLVVLNLWVITPSGGFQISDIYMMIYFATVVAKSQL